MNFTDNPFERMMRQRPGTDSGHPSAVLDEPEQKTDTISVPIPQCEESENIPLSDFPEQPENVQRPAVRLLRKEC